MKFTEKMFSGWHKSKSEPVHYVPRCEILRTWLHRYAERNNDELGVELRQELANMALDRTELLSFYMICKGDPDVIMVLDRKTPLEPYTHQEFMDLMSNEDHYRLMIKYTNKISAKKRELANKK